MAPSKPLPAAKDAPTWSGPLVQASITLPCVAIAVGAYMAAEAEVAHARRFGDAHLLHAVLLHPPLVMTVLAVAQLVCSMVAQRNFTTLRRLILVLLLLSSLGGMALGFVGPALRPTLSGTVEHTVAGVSGPVHLTRDENHLLHIHAATRRDAYFGQGYAVAQDRLFQMEFHRLIARGDLARVVGPAALPYDRKMRTLNILGASEQLCALADPAVMDLVQAFTDGINLYLEQDHTRPIEFFLMSRSLLAGHEPEPYAPLDVCLALRLFAYEICVNADREAMRFNLWVGTNRTYAEVDELFLDLDAQANSVLSVEQMLSLLVEDPATLTAEEKQAMLAKLAEAEKRSVELEALIYDGLLALMKPALRAERGLEPSTNDEDAATAALIEETHRKHAMHVEDLNPDASNLWATRDAQGRAMVSSDPHLVMRAPSVWFFAHLHFMTEDGAPFDVAGVVLPGVPGVHIGTSSHLAWGFTTSKTDLQDLFIFPPASWRGSPTANTSYVYDGQEHTFTRRQEIIHVKGREAPEVLEVEDSLFGPVVSHLHGYMQPTALFKTALFATPLQSDDAHSLAAILGMSDPAVRTAHDMMERVVELQAPGFSIISADRQGSIAYATTGRYPRRAPGHTGKIPTPAFDALGVLRAVCRHFGSTAAHDAEEDLVVELRACVASTLPTLKEEELLPIIQDALRTTSTTWKTFVHGPAERARSGANFARHPSSMNPHLSLPFDGKAAHFSSANQRIMPSPYAFFLSADYAPSYRGRRLQELLQTAQDDGTSHDASVHRRIQLDIQSNVWMFDLRHVVESEAFVAALTRVAPTSSSWATWRERLLAWDGIAVIGSEEVSFMWRWMERMSVLPRDAIRALKLTQWEPQTGHMMRMLRRPSARMESECAAYLHDVHHTAVEHRGACVYMAALLFDAEAESGRRQAWGIDANRVTASHELFRSGFLAKLFEMAMAKGGDFTSLAVSQHTASGSFPSTKASSVRQIFDLWNHTEHVRLSFPGGNSGIPFSSGYDTLWARFEAEEYVHVKARGHVEGQTHGHQLLIPRDHSA